MDHINISGTELSSVIKIVQTPVVVYIKRKKFSHQSLLCDRIVHTFLYGDCATRSTWHRHVK